ncbi:MAG: hypothetical protein ABI970_09260 [Chloroflexota bacterium]
MSFLEYREQIRQAAELIKTGDMQAARAILRPLCEGGSADAWWLLAQTTQDTKNIRYALQKAIDINPQHERATQQFAALFPDEEAPEVMPLLDRKPKEKQKKKEKVKGNPARAHWIRLLIVVLGGLVVGLSVVVLFSNLTYTLPPPVLGPYYERYMYPYLKQAPAPCSQFLVFGQVKQGPGIVAHMWIRDYDQQVTTDAQGNFQLTLPKDKIVYEREPNNHYVGDVPVKFQLLDQAGGEQSGINNLLFLHSCALYLEFWHENSGGLKIGNPSLRPASWGGPYNLAYSKLTTTPLLICEFTGFTGTAYDDDGPMKDLSIQIVNLDEHFDKPHYSLTYTQGLEAQMGPSWWYIAAEPEHRYVMQIVNPQGAIIITDIIYLPKKQGCGANLIKVSIMKAENRGNAAPLALPTGWGKAE